MCGIAGVFSPSSSGAIEPDTLRGMLGQIRHRGPDEFGIYLADQVGLGSARLSIVDLEQGQQPIPNEDRTLWIVFNGEIFNHPALRDDLRARGHRFRTQTDTEVILHLYEEMGPACLDRLNGQFAFAIWDERNEHLFLARDRYGIRPLFYTQVGDDLLFGSEIKSFLAHPGFSAEIDPTALAQTFTYWSPLGDRTAFRDVRQVPPGHHIHIDKDGLRSASYWEVTFPPARNGEKRPVEAYVEDFRDLLIDATTSRLRGDVPVGAYLSGGLDSSVITTVIRKFAGNQLDTFSIAFDDTAFDESSHQERMASYLGTDHHVLRARYADIGWAFPDVIWHTEAPILRTSPAPLYLLSRAVQEAGYKVVLTGEGADEFLAGYNIFKEAAVRRFWARQPDSAWRPRLFERIYPYIDGLQGRQGAVLARFFGHRLNDVDAPDYSHAIRWRNTARTQRFFSAALREQIGQQSVTDAGADALTLPPEFETWDPLHQAQYLEITIFLAQYLLSSQGDRMAMAHSVEGRFPFLDHRLTTFCNQVPPRLKLRGLTEKYLLKQVAREWVPDDIWTRTKRPYRAPIHRSFLHDETPAYVDEVLHPTSIERSGYFNPVAVQRLVKKATERGRLSETDDMALAGILSTELLHHHFVDAARWDGALSDTDHVLMVDRRAAAPSMEQ